MKFALVVCFAALVACEPEAKPEAQADPALLYGAYGYGYHPYAYGAYGYAGYPYAIMPFTTARGPLMLSQRLRLILPSSTALMATLTPMEATDTDMLDTPTPIMATTMARGPLMPSPPLLPSLLPMLMPGTGTTVMVPGPTTGTDWDTDTDWATEATTMDKFSASEVQSRSSKRTSLLVI